MARSATTRTVKVKFDGDAKGLAQASRDGERELDKFAKNTKQKFDKAGGVGKSFGSSLKKWFSGEGGGLLSEIGKSGGTVFGSGLLGAIKTPILGPALLATFAAVAATVMPAAGAIAGGALVTGFGAGIAGLGLVFAAKSAVVKSEWSSTVDYMGTQLTTLSRPFETTLVSMARTARSTFSNLAPEIGAAFAKMAEPLANFGRYIGRSLEQFKPAIAPVTDAFNAVIDSLGPALVDMTGQISTAMQDLAASVQKNLEALADTARGVGGLTSDLTGLLTSMNNANGAVRNFTGGVSLVTIVFTALRGAIQIALGPLLAIANLMSKLPGAAGETGQKMVDAANGTNQLATANTALAPKVQGSSNALEDQKKKAAEAKQAFEDLIQKTFQLANTTLGLSGAQINFQASIDRASASVAANGRTLDVNTEKGRANRSALNDVASSANAQTEAMLRAGRGNAAAAQSAEGSRANFVKLATQMGVSRGAAEAMARQMIAIPNVSREAKLTADKRDLDTKLANARAQLADPKLTATKRAKLQAEISQLLEQKRRAQAAIDSLRGKTVTVTTINKIVYQGGAPKGQQSDPTLGGLVKPTRASGGPVQPRRTYLVGERGPEFLTMGSQPGRVTSAESGIAPAAGPSYADVHIEIGGEVVRVVRTELKQRDRDLKRTVKAGADMGLVATYDATLSRVKLLLTGANGAATRALFERSTDGIRWTAIRGGYVDVNSGAAVRDDYEFPAGEAITYRVKTYTGSTTYDTFTDDITQDLDRVWLKVPAVPFLNTPVTVVDRGTISRRSRGGTLDVRGRSLPVLVGELASSTAFTLQLLTETPAEERDLDYTLSTGDVVFLHLPSGVDLFPGGYFAVGDVQRESTLRKSPRRLWSLPLTEVAAPGPDVVGSAYTCASVLAEYVTVTAMLADNATILDLLGRTGSPSEVLVP